MHVFVGVCRFVSLLVRVLSETFLELGKLFCAVFHLYFTPGACLDHVSPLVPKLQDLVPHFGQFAS